MKTPRILLTILTVLFTFGLSAQAQTYIAFMNGPSENPVNASPGTGFAMVTFDLMAHTMHVQASFSGLLGTTTAAHIHAPVTIPGGNAGVATQLPSFSGFPLGVTSGMMDTTFDMTLASTWNASYITANGGTAAGAEAAFTTQVANGQAYFNIHSTSFGGGEIRGFLVVPEPSTVALLAFGGIGLLVAARKARRN